MTAKLFMSPIFVINWNDSAFFPLLCPFQWSSECHKYILKRSEHFFKLENKNFITHCHDTFDMKNMQKLPSVLRYVKRLCAFSLAFKQIKTKDLLTPFAQQILLNFLFLFQSFFLKLKSKKLGFGQWCIFWSSCIILFPTLWSLRFHFNSIMSKKLKLKKTFR